MRIHNQTDINEQEIKMLIFYFHFELGLILIILPNVKNSMIWNQYCFLQKAYYTYRFQTSDDISHYLHLSLKC